MRKKYIVFIIVIALFFLGCNDKKGYEEKNNKDKTRYKVAFNLEQPPLLYREVKTGEIKGFIYDIGKEIERRGNFIFCWEETPLSKIFDEVTVKNYDIGIAPFISTEERKNKVNITESFYTSQIIVLGNREIDYKESKEPIYGVQTESIVLDKVQGEDSGKVIVSSKEERLLDSLLNRDIDYMVTDSICGNEILKKNPQLFNKEVIEEVSISFITSKTLNKDDLKRINEIILEMKSDGTIEDLKKKYDI